MTMYFQWCCYEIKQYSSFFICQNIITWWLTKKRLYYIDLPNITSSDRKSINVASLRMNWRNVWKGTGLEKILYCDVLDHNFYYIIYQEIQCTKKYNVPRNTMYQEIQCTKSPSGHLLFQYCQLARKTTGVRVILMIRSSCIINVDRL